MSDPTLYRMAKQEARYWISRCRRDRPALMAFMFHAVVEEPDELKRGLIDPSLCVTIQDLRDFIQFYQSHDYRFVAPSDVNSDLPADGKYVLITFDDGYFNNQSTLPVLREFQVPAVFSIATAYVDNGKSFWWDVLYRGRFRKAIRPRKIAAEMEYVKSMAHHEVEAYLVREFGVEALDPTCDGDRPFRPNELAAFAREPLVHLGNHTRDHVLLANVSATEARHQIVSAQEDLCRWTGITAQMIAYPHGVHSASVRQAAKDAGLVLGVTVEHRKNDLQHDLDQQSVLDLGRFQIRHDHPLLRQLELFRGHVYRRKKGNRPTAAA